MSWREDTTSPLRMYADTSYEGGANEALLQLIGPTLKRVLDVGCGAGANAQALTGRGHRVWAITASSPELKAVRSWCEEVFLWDVESAEEVALPDEFDCLLFSHVLEHLRNPKASIQRLLSRLRAGGVVAIAVPNMAHWRLRWQFLRGHWERTDTGPLDRTHLQFWSYDTALDLISGLPLRLIHRSGDFAMPLWPLRRLSSGASEFLDRRIGRLVPNFSATQIILLAERL
jgi:SAM-dependent methyltransferase